MRRILTAVFLALLIVIAAFSFYIYSGSSMPEFVQVDKISVSDMKLLPNPSFELSARLEFNNPNAIGVDIDDVTCDIYIQDSKTATVDSEEKVEAPANGHFFIPVNTRIDLSEQDYAKIFGNNLFESLLNNEINLKFKGEMTLSKFGINRKIPFNYDYKYKIL